MVNDQLVIYNAFTLPDPPALSYKVHQIEQLVKDWSESSFLIINGIGIPISFWQKLYRRTRPNVWRKIKDQWLKYKFIVGGFQTFENAEKFWSHMRLSVATQSDKEGGERLNMKVICKILREDRAIEDNKHVEAAKREFENFTEVFTYRKAGKKVVMTNPQDVARLYRKHKRIAVYWDEELESNGEESEKASAT